MTMTESAAVYLVLIALWSTALIGLSASAYRRARLKRNRYRLFEVRDRLYHLVIDDRLDEDSHVFQVACGMINGVIANIRDFTLRNFVQALLNEERNLEENVTIEKFLKELEHSDPEVQQVVADFFSTSMSILLDNSPGLRLLVRARNYLGRRFRRVIALLPTPATYAAYKVGENNARLFGKGGSVPHSQPI